MNEMLKRATKAAFDEIARQCAASGQNEPDDFSDGDFTAVLAYGNFNLQTVIRAAIEAMREPTEPMVAVGRDELWCECDGAVGSPYEETVKDGWRAMIGAALKLPD